MNGSVAADLQAPRAFAEPRAPAIPRPPQPRIAEHEAQEVLAEVAAEAFAQGLSLGFLAGRLYVGHVRDGLGHREALRMALAEAARDLARGAPEPPGSPVDGAA
ncbi:MAG TPA: hypothetical protein VNO34_07525 [Actinomycetota bacterium]|nr:hypothetical protein [Actinomycetota bacterium]